METATGQKFEIGPDRVVDFCEELSTEYRIIETA